MSYICKDAQSDSFEQTKMLRSLCQALQSSGACLVWGNHPCPCSDIRTLALRFLLNVVVDENEYNYCWELASGGKIAETGFGATLFGNTGLPITSFPDTGELIIGSLELGNAGLTSIDLSHVSGII